MKKIFSAWISILICLAMLFSLTSCLDNPEVPDGESTNPDGSENANPDGDENTNPDGGENTNPDGGENTNPDGDEDTDPESNKSPSDDIDNNGWTKL